MTIEQHIRDCASWQSDDLATCDCEQTTPDAEPVLGDTYGTACSADPEVA